MARPIDPLDRERIVATMNAWVESEHSFLALRTRAFVLLCWGSGLLVSEVISLNLADVLVIDAVATGRWSARGAKPERFRGAVVSKRGRVAPGELFTITRAARAALREYVTQGVKAGWLQFPNGPLFVGTRGRARARIGVRAAQHTWTELQTRAQLERHYRTDDLRHDAIKRFAARAHGNVHRIQAFARFVDLRTATRYVPELAARA